MSLRVSMSSAAHLGLLRAHVQRRADHLREPRVDRLVGQLLADRLGDAEVDDLHHRLAVVQRDQHVRGLEVAVDDPLLVGVLHRLADVTNSSSRSRVVELVLVAVVGDRHAA